MKIELFRIFGKRVSQTVLAGALLAALTPLSADESRIAYEDPGKIKVVEGEQCGEIEPYFEGNTFIKDVVLEGSMPLPDYYGSWNATVFLNGWRLRYLGDDQHVALINAAIGDITLDDSGLHWQAIGLLADHEVNNAYEFCYRYTAIAWDQDSIRAVPDYALQAPIAQNEDDDGNHESSAQTTLPTTRMLTDPGLIRNDGRPAVILPGGFAFAWGGISDVDDIDEFKDWLLSTTGQFMTHALNPSGSEDNHLLQLAYNKGPGTSLTNNGSLDPAQVSWVSQGILKDDETRRDHLFGETVTALGGEDVYMIEPPFSVSPRNAYASGLISTTGCAGAANEVNSEDIVVENVPFDYAIPILTGWELHYGCGDDAHVKKIGVWVDNIQYDKDPDEATGTLRYRVSSVMRDNDLVPGHNARHKVSILGLNAGVLKITYDGTTPGELAGVDDSSSAPTTEPASAPTRSSVYGVFR